MNFKQLDNIHKRHVLLNCKILSFLLIILNQLLDDDQYREVSKVIADLNADIVSLNDCEVDQLIADIQKDANEKKFVIRVQVSKDRN